MDLKNKNFHFIAIGGVGMSALAKYLIERGCTVSGSDLEESKYTHLLESLGVKISIGHDKNLIKKDMIIVASSAIKSTNEEIIRAKELGLKVYHRSDILKMISDEFADSDKSYFIGFCGTHGKTTTSGMASYILNRINEHPSFVVGGIIPELNTNGQYDGNRYFVAELDESDGTIQKYKTDIAVINNMEEDHLDFYKNGFNDIAQTFNKFLKNNPSQTVVINSDNEGNKKFMQLYPDYKYITFGLIEGDYRAKNIISEGFGTKFDVYKKEQKLCSLELSIPGIHNVYNALAVYCALDKTGAVKQNLSNTFKNFTGMGRRFQKVCDFSKINVYDDYAHHPSEIKTTLNGIKSVLKSNEKLVAIFQPHRYTRLNALWNEFKNAFKDADELFITDVYPAGEEKIDGINSNNFSKEVNHKNCKYISGTMEDCAKQIYPFLKENDIVITLGAGSITKLGGLLKEQYDKVVTK